MLAALLLAAALPSLVDPDEICRQSLGSACSSALGNWLPLLPNSFKTGFEGGTPTSVRDEVVDPAGAGKRVYGQQPNVYRGTFFAYGSAGPSRGRVVYDPAARIAYFDEGCCGWHHVVIAVTRIPPPQPVATRTLANLHTLRGIRLGDSPGRIQSTFGTAPLRSVADFPNQQTLTYLQRTHFRRSISPCEAMSTFLFDRRQLIALDFTDAC